ncbi:trehalose-phosphatase [Geothermobacter hydrogeniphilus]|uniref:Trehalose 6-phosphate phosphatase n=1 Tax=Geothermobacter hydrogeniphilus TaxID=1969733 RepID=A0A1X0YAB4_9BACT|nr:trehalose-phosphatase [Geothermobacter hydrogeniphilus]ORJ62042.1 trehalose-phosphatase [Geothermobacter hydrogeniphilus]
MSEIPTDGLPADFWPRVEHAPQRLLMLDYDGTLAPFVPDRDRAFPYPGIRELLSELLVLQRTRLVIVTGRAVADMPPLLQLEPLPEIWGCHGWERRLAGGDIRRVELPVSVEGCLQRAWSRAVKAGIEDHLERKPASLAIHWRGLDEARKARLEDVASREWASLAADNDLQLHPFDGGLELRCPGRTKGDAVRELRAESPPGTLAVYLGDDLTDEDAFAALGEGDVGILVREQPRASRASCRLRPPDQLLEFLRTWLRVCRHGG